MTVVDAALVPVPASRREAYRAFAARMAQVYRDHGALRVLESWGSESHEAQEGYHADDAKAALRGAPDLRDAAGARGGEVVVLSMVEWPDRATRDRAMARIARDPRVQATTTEAPVFDGVRMRAGTFAVILDA